MSAPRVVVVTFDAAQILDVTGPLEVFSTASRFVDSAAYGTEVVTTRGGPVVASCGLEFASRPAQRRRRSRGHADRGRRYWCARRDPWIEELLHHVRRLAAGARRTASVCSGAFVLAAAGLLEGRRATTTGMRAGSSRSGTRVSRWTPTPSTSGTATYGRRPVGPPGSISRWPSSPTITDRMPLRRSLRRLVVYLQRSGGQAQFSALLAGQAADTEPVRDLLSWLRDHLTDDLSVAALARQLNLSERQFTRVFKSEVGVTAAGYVEAVRLDSACRLLETTNRTIAQITLALRLVHDAHR